MSEPFLPAPRRSIDMAGLKVFLAMPTHRDLHPLTVVALLDTQKAFLERGIPLSVEVVFGGSLVHHSRSKIAWDFLQSDHNRIFWVDSDIVWTAKDFAKLVALSVEMPIVAAAYPAKQDPTIFFQRGPAEAEMNEWGCLPRDGVGMGFCCVRREVMEALAAKAPKLGFHHLPEPIPHIFRFGETDGAAQGEDMAFFEDAKALGFQLWVDPTVSLGHIGPHVYRAALIDYLTPVAA